MDTRETMQIGEVVAATGSPYARLGAGVRSPFQSFPFPTEPQTEFLLQYCKYLIRLKAVEGSPCDLIL